MTSTDYELIDKKIAGELTPNERQRFTERMQQDPVFAQAYRTQQAAIEALQAHHTQTLRDEVRQMHARVKARRRRTVRRYYAAAAVVLLGVLGLATYRYTQPPTAQQLYSTYYTVYPAQRVARGDDTTSYETGVSLYARGQYGDAIPYFRQKLIHDSLPDRTRLLLANCYLQTHQPEAAQRVLRSVATSDDALLRQQGQWYLALSYLKQDDFAQARPVLETLAAQGMYQKEAREILVLCQA